MYTKSIGFAVALAIAVFSLGYMNAFAAKPTCPDHPSCKPPPVSPIMYTAELTGTVPGAFVFESKEVTPNAKEDGLQFEINPVVSPLRDDENGGDGRLLGDWFNVFNSCDALTTSVTPPESFMVDTVVDKGGHVRVGFIGIEYGPDDRPVEVVVQLIGTEEDFDEPFLPAPGKKSAFLLSQALLQGHTLKGIRPKGHCNKDGQRLDLYPDSKLVITASCRSGSEPPCTSE